MKISTMLVAVGLIACVPITSFAALEYDCTDSFSISDSSVSPTPLFGFLCNEYDTITQANSVVVKIKNIDSSLYKKIKFGRNAPHESAYSVSIIGDMNGNDTPELVVFMREGDWPQVTRYQEVRDMATGTLIKRVKF